MGGRGRKRREKNYRASHGGPARLPPPPDLSKLDTLPSKLRQILAFSSPPSHGSPNVSKDSQRKRKREDGATDRHKKQCLEKETNSEATAIKKGGDDDGDGHLMKPQRTDSDNEIAGGIASEKRKKKRKGKQVNDLRFEMPTQDSGTRSKRKERKKKYLEAKKKKHKKASAGEDLDFPGHEKIIFGDVVEAPPKLIKVPKAFKTIQDASQERIRLQTIEAYRKRKGWTSRPGLQLPSIMNTPTL